MSTELEAHLEEALAPAALSHGFELVAVELAGGHGHPILRVFLDKEGGIGLDDICEANSWVAALLDEREPFERAYTLEVSSPGIDRPLRKLGDFERFQGSTAMLKTRPLDGRTRFTGTIRGVADDVIALDVDGKTVRIPFSDVRNARLKGEVDFGQGKDGCEQ
ncbi:MAG: ribosome maturation factor RimP [Anaerosomatales bacterium]|nr:ribosome maturation factor RimP [Anaerosomatales bacterium]MDT8433382.1 ribosome maturation factor RimP [Anaerosomatales bacterium]